MPPQQVADPSHLDGDIPIKEIVFSCGVCQKPLSDVYSTKESDYGFNGSENDDSGVVVKFWMADCSHTFCGKHLEGGGAPFHRQDQQPSAQCPVCLMINPQRTGPHELFVIRGLKKGEYAKEIPDTYLECPPASLKAEGVGMDAFRFQYFQIVRYSKAITTHWSTEQRKRRILESSFSKERKQWRKQEADFKDRIAALEKGEAKLKKWEQRREMINHYLGLVGKMGEDINRMRSQLAQVGLHVPDGHYAFEPSRSDAPDVQQQATQPSNKSRGDSAATLVGDQNYPSSSSRKRRHSAHEEYVDDKEDRTQTPTQVHRRNSRELMPPPLPRPRQPPQSMPLRSQPVEGSFAAFTRNAAMAASRNTIQVYDNGGWDDSQTTVPVSEHDCAPTMPVQQHVRQNLGALPFRPSQRLAPNRNPRPNIYEERHEPYYVDDVDARYQLPASSAPTLARGLLSQPPRRPNQAQPYSRAQVYVEDARPRAGPAREGAHSRISYFDSDYGMVAQQSGEHVPREMESFRPEPSEPHPFVPFARPLNSTRVQSITRPQRSNPQPSAGSVASPFFKTGAVARPDTVQRPPALGNMAPPPPPPRRSDVPTSSIGGHAFLPSRSSVVQPGYRNKQASSQGHHPAPMSSQRQSSSTPPSIRAHSSASRYQSASQPTYQRVKNIPSEAGSYAPTRSVSMAQRNRVDLPPRQPPSSWRVPQGSLFDPQLSQMRGVRGAHGSQVTYNRQGLSSSQQPPRSTYSAASVRRSVLR